MQFALQVFNPSHYDRGGHVATPWQPIFQGAKIKPEQLVLIDESDKELPYQIDALDPANEARTVLSFSLASPIKKFSSSIIRLVKGTPTRPAQIEPRIEVVSVEGQDRGVRLTNDQLEVWFNLIAAPENDGRSWFSGSATNVKLHGEEMLGFPIRVEETRCMQLDFIELSYPAWETELFKRVQLFDNPYKLIYKNAGPVNAVVTLASKSFLYAFKDPFTNESNQWDCKLYRVITLPAGSSHLLEELFIRADTANDKKSVNLFFTAQYFSCLNTDELRISQFEGIPDWFMINSPTMPFHSYGFATNAHSKPIAYPHPGFPIKDRESGSFSWQLFHHSNVISLHLFKRYPLGNRPAEDNPPMKDVYAQDSLAKSYFEDEVGRAWFEIIYKPLWASLQPYPPTTQPQTSTDRR